MEFKHLGLKFFVISYLPRYFQHESMKEAIIIHRIS